MSSFVSTVSTSSLGCSRCGGRCAVYFQIDERLLCPRCFNDAMNTAASAADAEAHLEALASTVRLHLTAPDDDYRDALLLAALTRFFQAWDRGRDASTGPIAHPNRDS